MKSPHSKLSLPEKRLPDLLRLTTPLPKAFKSNVSNSSSPRQTFGSPSFKTSVSLQLKPSISQNYLIKSPESPEFKFSEDMKKFNSFIDPALSKSFIREFSVDETPHGLPAGRKDVKMLIEWLDFMLQRIAAEKNDNPDKLFDMANEIYSSCFHEVIKQVSAHCKERGYLISRVWKAYSSLFEKALTVSKQKNSAALEKNLSEKVALTSYFSDKLKDVEEKLLKVENEKAELATKLALFEEKQQESIVKELKMLNTITILQTQYKIVKRELLMSKEDTRILKVRYDNIAAENQYNNVMKRLIIPKRFKRKTTEILDKELSKDPLISSNISEDSDILDKLSKFGKIYVDRSLENIFNQDDFHDRGTETIQTIQKPKETQTEVEFLCGDTIGVKMRRAKNLFTSNKQYKISRPTFFPDFKPYTQRALTLEANKLNANPLSPELKKKHQRVRRLLSIISQVSSQ